MTAYMMTGTSEKVLEAVKTAQETLRGELESIFNDATAAEKEQLDQLLKMSQFEELAQNLQQFDLFVDAAELSGLSLREWMFEVLTDAADKNSSYITINREIFDRIKLLAQGRGISIDQVTTSQAITDHLRTGLDNHYI